MIKFTSAEKTLIAYAQKGIGYKRCSQLLDKSEQTVKNQWSRISWKIQGGYLNGDTLPDTGINGLWGDITQHYAAFLESILEIAQEGNQPPYFGHCAACLDESCDSVQFVASDLCFLHWLESRVNEAYNKAKK